MASKIFLTGATGYIGGSVLHALVTAHPEYDITVLLRKTPDTFASKYPNVHVVQGDYDSAEILAEQARRADVVVHNGDSDHEPSLQSLLRGLVSKETQSSLLHLSGTGILSDWASPTHLGGLNPRVYSDVDDLETIASLPDHAMHRNTEKILFNAAAEHGDKVAVKIMCPPDIYGTGLGPGNTSTIFIKSFLADAAAHTSKRPFYVGEGANARSWVHIADLARLYVRVVEDALASSPSPPSPETAAIRYPEYFFASTQEHTQLEVASAIGAILEKRGVVADAAPVRVELEALDKMAPHPLFPMLGRYLYASNPRSRAVRAKRSFGYEGREKDLMECLEGEVARVLEA